VRRLQHIAIVVIGVVCVGIAAGEYVAGRSAERRYRGAVEAKRQLEARVGHVLTTHEQLQRTLTSEQQRSHELTDALWAIRSKLEEAVGRLSQETQTVRELHMRLASMQQQMDQLQGELVIALQGRQGATTQKEAQGGAVQLERIVVSRADAPGLHGRVLSIDKNWNFVVVDLGWSAVNIGDMLSIYREEQLLAKARVERVQEGICAATLLPEWSTTEIHINDQVRAL